jgi:ornithine cyclodeaminase/alanine dehydrogenase-like protein (mu-crystallin family)
VETFDAGRTRAALAFEPLIAALERMFAAGCTVPPRHIHTIADGVQSLLMPAWTTTAQGRAYYGVKIVNVAPGNRARGLPGLFATYQLFDGTTGELLALVDGDEITARRTAAASALAASHLARADARELLVVGTGRVGRVLPEAYLAVRNLDRIVLWDRHPANAQALADELRSRGLPVEAAAELEPAVRAADIVSTATAATQPLIHGAWLSPQSHLDLIGSYTPAMREADDECVCGAELWVDTPEALDKSGDLVQPLATRVLSRSAVQGTLQDLCRGAVRPGGGARRTVFKSVGTALEDLAAAILVYESRG